MKWRPIAGIMLRQFYLMRGSPVRVLPLFAWVAIDIVLWGFITRYLNSVSAAGINFVSTLLGAVLLWALFTRVMHGVTTAFLEDVWSRNFLNLFATPLRLSEYVTGLVLTGLATSAVGLLAMLLLASVFFGLPFFTLGALLIPFLLVLIGFGIALGILASGLVLRFGPASEWLVWPLPALVSPFACVFYPLSVLPPWMRAIAYALPPSYVFEGLRAVLDGDTPSLVSLLWASLLAIAYVAAAGFGFSRVYRDAVRSGLLARYSGETVS
jgi:ABC-2 type transport system permease protein